MRIGVLEDDPEQLRLVEHALQLLPTGSENLSCSLFSRGEDLLKTLKRGGTYDLLLLDWVVPDVSGQQIVQWVRSYVRIWLPIIVISARDGELDVVEMLSSGADDYIVKPFRKHEMLARVMACLRQSRSLPKGTQPQRQTFGRVTLDTVNLHARIDDGAPIALTEKEMRLALLMYHSAQRPLSRDYLLQSVWGQDHDSTRKLDTHISHLRRKLQWGAGSGWHLSTVYGVGYTLQETQIEKASYA